MSLNWYQIFNKFSVIIFAVYSFKMYCAIYLDFSGR